MTIQEKLQMAISEALKNLGAPDVSFSLEHPTELAHGDFATNAALASAKKLGKNSREVAELLKTELESGSLSLQERAGERFVESIEIAGPGFLNFKLKDSYFVELNKTIFAQGEEFGKSNIHAGKKILVEHSSPNLFKPFHIGHMMNNAIGESLVQIMKFSGADVSTMSFPSDISLGVAKAVFVLLEKYPLASQGLGTPPYEGGDSSSWLSIENLGSAYVEGTKRYDDDESVHERVKEIADNLYAEIPSPELSVFEKCKTFNIAYFESVTEKLGSHFDSYIYESEAGVDGKKIVEENTPNVFTKSEGATVYIPDELQKNLNTLVFINSQGNPTYEAKDIGLLDLKFSRVNPDLSLFVTDHQQIPHFDVVLDAAGKINPMWKEKSIHVPHGRMSFKGQKMSSRLGGVPLATEMIETVADEAMEKSEKNSDRATAETIAIAAIKFSILRTKPGQNINFDPETSLSFEGDSGPYLQYTHARISSLIEKALALGIVPSYKNGESATDLERVTLQFNTVVESAITEYAPQHIVTYLLELARTFNSFYGANKIIDEADTETSAHRLAIASATQVVLKNGLKLLGIKAPEKM